MKRILLIGVASAASLFGVAAVAAPAMASNGPGTVTAVTHAADHPDTTNVETGLDTLSNGPVWAWDNSADKFTATPIDPAANGGANWSVVATVTGSFQGFADPQTGQPLTSTGSVKGTIQYNVKSASQPSAANLPSQEPGVASHTQAELTLNQYPHLTGMINQLFGGGPLPTDTQVMSIVGGGDYNFSYQNGNYVQNTNGITGDVQGH